MTGIIRHARPGKAAGRKLPAAVIVAGFSFPPIFDVYGYSLPDRVTVHISAFYYRDPQISSFLYFLIELYFFSERAVAECNSCMVFRL